VSSNQKKRGLPSRTVPFFVIRAPLKIPSANRFQLKQTVKHGKAFGPHFSESFAKSQLQNPGYAPSIWLVFEKMSHRASRNEFLEVPIIQCSQILIKRPAWPGHSSILVRVLAKSKQWNENNAQKDKANRKSHSLAKHLAQAIVIHDLYNQ